MKTTRSEHGIIISYEDGDEIPKDALLWRVIEIGDDFVKIIDPSGKERLFPKPEEFK